MVPQVGQRIGPYEILGRLGSGGMGLVFSAWDARLQRDVAIKLLREEFATPEMRSRFLQEARAASGLNHPNICTIFDIGEQEGDPYLVMELLKGETLRSRINQGGITAKEILRVAHDIADALSVAHGRGVIHRDIKPANIILVNKAGGAFGTKVLDFGLAKIDTGYDGDSLLDLTNTGTTVGTVSYMSPEQARGETLDFRSDLFSLGVMLYEMATGRLPFQGATSALVFVQLLSHAPDPIRPQNPQITEDLERLILKLLDKDRNHRFQSASELMDAVGLIPFAGSSPSHADHTQTAQISTPPSVPLAKPVERRESANPVPVERRNSSRVFPRNPGLPGEPPTLPVRRSAPPGASSPATSVAKQPVAPVTPEADVKPMRPAMSGDEFLRPVRRVATPLSESSAYNLRAVREPSGVRPAAPPSADVATHVTPVPSASVRPPASSASNIPAAHRPITQQAVRPVSSSQTEIPAMNLPRVTSVRPTPRYFAKVDDQPEAAKPESSRHNVAKADSSKTVPVSQTRVVVAAAAETVEPKPRMWLLVVGFGVMLAIGIVAWNFWPRTPVAVANRTVPLVIAHVTNLTGNETLPGAFAAGLELDLAQSPQILVQTESTLLAGTRAIGDNDADVTSLQGARRAAKPTGATEMLFGELRISGNSYVVAVTVNSVSTGGEVLRAEESAQSLEQLSDAIDRLAIDIRNGLGEGSDSISKSSLPLAKEATSNLDALQSYGAGSAFLVVGALADAQLAFERAASLDAHFTQPFLRLADVYRQECAMVAAANAATTGLANSVTAGERTQLVAQASFDLNASGDLSAEGPVIQKLMDVYPNSINARLQAANTLRAQGKFTDALDAAQGALRRSPLHTAAVAAAETSFIGLERFDQAIPLEAQAARSGNPHGDLKLLLTYLANGGLGPVDISTDAAGTGRTPLGVMQASLLDATGAEITGMRVWQTLANRAASTPHLESAAGDLFSHAALNRALVGDCATANQMISRISAYPSGQDTIFRAGFATALCGNLDAARDAVANLEQNYQTSFAAKGYYIPELNAVIHWKAGDAQAGLDDLGASTQYDLISMTPYLRGLMHMKVGQNDVAITNFQAVLSHRGAMSLMNPLVIPLAQIGLARAYAAKGDHANSAAAYAKFAAMWKNADGVQPLLDEAHAHAK